MNLGEGNCYAVVKRFYEGGDVVHVFANRVLAEKYCAELNEEPYDEEACQDYAVWVFPYTYGDEGA